MKAAWFVEVQEGQATLVGPFASVNAAFDWGNKRAWRDGERLAFTVKPMVKPIAPESFEDADDAWRALADA